MFVITHTELVSSKGQKLREFINHLNSMCLADLPSIKDSVIPVITKCKPNDDEIDLDEVKNTVQETINEEFKALTEYCQDNKIRESLM